MVVVVVVAMEEDVATGGGGLVRVVVVAMVPNNSDNQKRGFKIGARFARGEIKLAASPWGNQEPRRAGRYLIGL